MFLDYLDLGHEYLLKGIDIIRNIFEKLLSYLPWDETFSLVILFLGASFYISYFIISKFTTHPFEASKLIYLIIIAFLIFNLLYY